MAVIIEFAGPPGSGKTTGSAYFTEALREKNLVVYERRDLKRFVASMGRVQRWLLMIKTFLLRLPRLIEYTAILGYKRMLDYDAVKRYLRLCVFEQALQPFVKKFRPDLVILDQWMIQELWSACIFKSSGSQNLPDLLKRFYTRSTALVFFTINDATASERIGKRTNGLSRFDSMDDAARLVALQECNGLLSKFFHVAYCSHKMILPGENTLAANAVIFQDLVYRLRAEHQELEMVAAFPEPQAGNIFNSFPG